METRGIGRELRATVFFVAAVASSLDAQSVVDRTPNLDDGWIVSPGIIQFNFLHRFEVSNAPVRKVTSFPNFHIATGLPLGVNAALDYATNSTVFTGIPNEYQLNLRRRLLRQTAAVPLDVGVVAGYNFASQSVDAEVELVREVGRFRLLGAVRGLSAGYDAQRSLVGVGGGVVVRLTNWLSVAGDAFDIVNRPAAIGGGVAWGAGAQLRIPYSPHSLSIQVTNTRSASIQGASRGVRGGHMTGFEFTVPFTLARYFKRPAKEGLPPVAATDSMPPAPAHDSVTTVRIANLSFPPGEIHVRAGGRIRWVNDDQVPHSVTSNDGTFDSGLIEPGGTFEYVLGRPGVYAYHCMPHPFMKGSVVVDP